MEHLSAEQSNTTHPLSLGENRISCVPRGHYLRSTGIANAILELWAVNPMLQQ